MALIGNQSVLNKSFARFTNGTATAGAYAANTMGNKKNPSILFANRSFFPQNTSLPNNYSVGTAFYPAIKPGGMSSNTQINGVGSISAAALSVRLSAVTMSGLGEIDEANLSVLTQGLATIAGVGTISAAMLSTSSIAATIAGIGTISSANLSALVPLAGTLSGVGVISADIKGNGSMSATINIGGTNFVDASQVWSELAAENNDSGTMGELLNGAGGGSSPGAVADAVWDELTSGHTTAGTFGNLVQKLLTVAKFLGLK